MKKNKKQSYKKNLVLLSTIGFLILTSIFLVKKDKTILVFSAPTIKDKTNTLYPRQYSDRVTTVNAKIADERFKNFALLDENSLLSNAISSWIKEDEILSDGSLEKGTWLWTPIKYITPEYRDKIISGAKKNSINVIYLSIDSYLDIFIMPEGEDKDIAKKEFDKIIKGFINEANKNGIKVDAEAGWQNWSQKDHLYKAGAILDYVISFNRENEEKFRGFQYDVEVYLLPEYQENKKAVLVSFLDLINQTVTKLNNTGLEFSVVIPEFYDEKSEETPSFMYKWKRAHTLEHLLSVLERRKGSKIIIMSYRNFSQGKDGSIDVSEDEIYKANEYNTKVVIAQETGDFPPPYITFHNTSRSHYDKQVALINKAFEEEKSFGGLATHYINTFLELK
jgi:hypothetical protein